MQKDKIVMINSIEKMAETLSRINNYLLSGCRYAMIVTLIAIFVTVVVGVFFRYVLNNSLVWIEEIAKFTMVWLAFIGSPAAMDRGGHVAIEMISGRTRGAVRVIFVIGVQIIIISCLVLLFWKGIDLAVKAIPQHSTAVTWLSMVWVYLAVPAGSFLMLPITLQRGLTDIVKARKPADHPAEAEG
jgi:TRAP-type C4-dicarboxylate transport system permease small subunit